MRTFPLVLATALAVAGLPAAADAAAKKKPAPLCLQVTDPEADVTVGPLPAPSLDIVSGDIATGRNNLVVALRMKTLQRDAFLAGGITYVWKWTAGGATQAVAYYLYPTGEGEAVYLSDGTAGSDVSVKGTADPATSTITWVVPRKIVAPLKKAGAKLTGFSLSAVSALNWRDGAELQGTVGGYGDTATSTKTYTDFAPTCLKGT